MGDVRPIRALVAGQVGDAPCHPQHAIVSAERQASTGQGPIEHGSRCPRQPLLRATQPSAGVPPRSPARRCHATVPRHALWRESLGFGVGRSSAPRIRERFGGPATLGAGSAERRYGHSAAPRCAAGSARARWGCSGTPPQHPAIPRCRTGRGSRRAPTAPALGAWCALESGGSRLCPFRAAA